MNNDMIYSVSDLSGKIRQIIGQIPELGGIRLRGEVSGYTVKNRNSYFSLKDERCEISCVMWSSNAWKLSFTPKNGMKVIASGDVGVYEAGTKLQFYVNAMMPDGIGDIYRQLELLKARLRSEGLFDESRKKTPPMRPRKIAVVTSASGAVYHDIVKVTGRRDPGVPIVLVDVPVQGAGAGQKIAEGIRVAQSIPSVDVIIVGRGGGSMEDLWCFNDEALARAVAACPVPVISAVGHETDTTLCDYAADRRAATPSQAAEMAVPDVRELMMLLDSMENRMNRKISAVLQLSRTEQARLLAVLEKNRPENKLQQLLQREEHLRVRLDQIPKTRLQQERMVLDQLKNRLTSAPDVRLNALRPVPGLLKERLEKAGDRCLERTRFKLMNLRTTAEAVSPTRVLERGYAMAMDENGIPVTDAARARTLSRMELQFADGRIKVTGVEE